MNNNDQAKQIKRRRSFTEEMQQAFVDWVHKLPFIRKESMRDTEQGKSEAESAEQTPASGQSDSTVVPGTSNDKRMH